MKKFLKNFSLYMLPETFVNALPFITLPITTRYFGLEEFGLIALFNLCLLPFTMLCEYGAGYVMPALWFNLKEGEQKQLLFSLLTIGFCLAIGSTVILFPFYQWLFTLIANESAPFIIELFPWGVLMIVLGSIVPVFSNWIVLTERAWLFSKIKILEIVSKTTVTVGLIVYTQNVKFVIIGSCIVAAILCVIKLLILIPFLKVSFNQYFYIETYKIGYPIFFRSIFIQIRKRIDKLFISGLYSVQTFALYNWALQFNSLFSTIDGHFSKVYRPQLYQALSRGDNDLSKFRGVFFGWFYFVFFLSGCFYFVGKPLITLISNGVYTEAFPIILLLTIVFLISICFRGATDVIIHSKKTKVIFLNDVTVAIFGIPLTIYLIKQYSVVGGVFAYICISLFKNSFMSFYKYKVSKIIFIELQVISYIILYSVSVVGYLYNNQSLGINLMILTFIILTVHFIYFERIYIKNILSAFRGNKTI